MRQSSSLEVGSSTTNDGATDFVRWQDCSSSWGERNPLRSQIAGYHIPKGSSVLDIGAGSLVLKRYLRPGCHYQPCDLYSRCAGCLVADLNAGEFPEGRYDWVTMIGVLQFLVDPAWAVEQCHKVARSAIFTYSPTIDEAPSAIEIAWRRGEGWVNEFNRDQYRKLITDAGWDVIGEIKIHANLLMICHAKD